MSKNSAHRKNRIHAADFGANALITVATEVRAALRAKLSRPPEETPRAEVLLRVGAVGRLTTLALQLALEHRGAVASSLEATTRLTQAQQELADTKRHLEGVRKRNTTLEAEVRRYKLAAGEDVT